MKASTLFFTLFLLSSCSLFLNNFENDVLEQNDIQPLSQTKTVYCPNAPQDTIISETAESANNFNRFLKKIEKSKKLKFIDKAVLWSLLQMNLRPDLSSPTAKLQVVIKIKHKEEYLNSYATKEELFPFLKGLDLLLKKYKSRYSLMELASLLDYSFHYPRVVSSDFEQFLIANQKTLKAVPIFKKNFFRGDETLKELETLPALSIKSLVKRYQKTASDQNYKHKNFLFQSSENTKTVPMCNFDMGLYKDSLFLIDDKKIQSYIFGIKSKESTFMAVSGQHIKKISPLNKTFLIKGDSNVRSASLCLFKDQLAPKRHLWLVSTNSRDPGQHLFHLYQYGVEQVQNISELNSMMRFSRHLFLKNPVRLVIESRRSSEKQLNELLKLNIPIYNAKTLGTIWGFYQDDKDSSFILDDRRKGNLQCSSK